MVWALAVHDDGAGSALYAGGKDAQSNGFVARWDSVSWTELNGVPDRTVWALASFDDGSGSALYAVWTRQQVDLSNPGVFAPGRDARALFGAGGDDVFLVKMAYWLGR